ncbi:MAG: hypothetical protein MJ252_09705 [archaeon]|nr:hypothetical protein [archaeon]
MSACFWLKVIKFKIIKREREGKNIFRNVIHGVAEGMLNNIDPNFNFTSMSHAFPINLSVLNHNGPKMKVSFKFPENEDTKNVLLIGDNFLDYKLKIIWNGTIENNKSIFNPNYEFGLDGFQLVNQLIDGIVDYFSTPEKFEVEEDIIKIEVVHFNGVIIPYLCFTMPLSELKKLEPNIKEIKAVQKKIFDMKLKDKSKEIAEKMKDLTTGIITPYLTGKNIKVTTLSLNFPIPVERPQYHFDSNWLSMNYNSAMYQNILQYNFYNVFLQCNPNYPQQSQNYLMNNQNNPKFFPVPQWGYPMLYYPPPPNFAFLQNTQNGNDSTLKGTNSQNNSNGIQSSPSLSQKSATTQTYTPLSLNLCNSYTGYNPNRKHLHLTPNESTEGNLKGDALDVKRVLFPDASVISMAKCLKEINISSFIEILHDPKSLAILDPFKQSSLFGITCYFKLPSKIYSMNYGPSIKESNAENNTYSIDDKTNINNIMAAEDDDDTNFLNINLDGLQLDESELEYKEKETKEIEKKYSKTESKTKELIELKKKQIKLFHKPQEAISGKEIKKDLSETHSVQKKDSQTENSKEIELPLTELKTPLNSEDIQNKMKVVIKINEMDISEIKNDSTKEESKEGWKKQNSVHLRNLNFPNYHPKKNETEAAVYSFFEEIYSKLV